MEKTILIVKKRSSKYRPEYRATNTRLVRLRMLKPCGYASSNILTLFNIQSGSRHRTNGVILRKLIWAIL